MKYLLYPFDVENSIGSFTVFAESVLMIRQLEFMPISKSGNDVYGELTHGRANTDTPVFRGVTFGTLPFPKCLQRAVSSRYREVKVFPKIGHYTLDYLNHYRMTVQQMEVTMIGVLSEKCTEFFYKVGEVFLGQFVIRVCVLNGSSGLK